MHLCTCAYVHNYAFGPVHASKPVLHTERLSNPCMIGCLYLLCWQYDYVRARYDWHTLPGVTEEWRTDAIPKGHSKDSNRCGGNLYAGVVSDGVLGVSAFHMLPHPDDETGYTVVSANKAYFFLDFGVVALGNSITRLTSGQGRPIVTTLDQARWRSDITYQVGNGGSPTTLPFSIGGGCATSVTIAAGEIAWLHQGSVGYIVRAPPSSSTTLELKCGGEVDATDNSMASASGWGNREDRSRWDSSSSWYKTDIPFLAVLHHGINPVGSAAEYLYIILPGTTPSAVAARAANFFVSEVQVIRNDANVQAVVDTHNGQSEPAVVAQIAFLTGGVSVPLPIGVGGASVDIMSSRPAVVQLRRVIVAGYHEWQLAAVEGTKDTNAQTLTLTLSAVGMMTTGSYSYILPGVEPRAAADTVSVIETAGTTMVEFGLPDIGDDESYNYTAAMYVGSPISVSVPLSGAAIRPSPTLPPPPVTSRLPLPPLPPSPPLPPPLPSSPKRCPTSIPANTILGQYFDIAAGSVSGSWVSGRLNPKANRNWRTEPLASWSFTLVEDANGLIEVINERDTEGRLFGGLRVSDGRTLGGAGEDVELVAELYRSNELVGCHAFRVHVLEQTVMSVMRQRVLDYALTENHMWGRNQPSESSIRSMASSVVSSSGRLPGAPSMHLKVLYGPPRRPKASST